MIVVAGASEAGKALARHLAAALDGDFDGRALGEVVPSRWEEAGQFLLVCATGIAVRLAAPLLAGKDVDPGIVTVDDAGRFAVALSGGHEGGANGLAARVGALIGAEPVITTASEAPADLVVGVGCSTDVPADEIVAAVTEAVPAPWKIAVLATLDRKAVQPSVAEAAGRLGLPVLGYAAEELAAVAVPNPSEAVAAAVGTPSVAEAAALLAAGASVLERPKAVRPRVTVAVARREPPRRPEVPSDVPGSGGCGQSTAGRGHLAIVGLGPGDPALLAPAARRAVREADVVIGYRAYVEQVAPLLRLGQDVRPSPLGDEVARARDAVGAAAAGRRVALVSSGDAGVYAMASVALEVAPDGLTVDVVPGITAAQAAAARLGAPLGHDFCTVSLSDLLTPWDVIEARLRAAAEADFVVALYNPRSRGRDWQLGRAVEILAGERAPDTPVGMVTAARRPREDVVLTTLAELDPALAGMTTTVIVGSSRTTILAGRMVTPRGYAT